MSTAPVQYLSNSDTLCKRCSEKNAVLISRRDAFCSDCFVWFVRGKQRKSMLNERYKVKYGAVAEKLGTQKVLLPLSFGTSSLVLLDMVASLLREQNLAHKGKQGFELVVLHILEENGPSKAEAESIMHELLSRYDPVTVHYRIIDPEMFLLDKKSLQRIQVSAEFDVLSKQQQLGNSLTVSLLLESCRTNSSRADLLQLIYHDLIIQSAIQLRCNTILLGHSMTRLASEILSMTVKGRGVEIHEAIADRSISYEGNEFHIIFPFRDILFAEVEAVLSLTDGLKQFHVETSKGTSIAKNMTVQALSTKYFDDLGANGYASTASTVVKTAEKLGAPKCEITAKCRICQADIYTNPKQWLKSITVNAAAPLETEAEVELAEDYAKVIGKSHVSGDSLDVCYGCTVMLLGAGDQFAWPMRATREEILDEFVLTDEE
ncbi:hypothetical protein CJI97_002697 [Candidozyma auris]|nr:hypothetical protein CJI97_002697 [[Candida] auris]